MKIKINDLSHYVPLRSRNGGGYWFEETAVVDENGAIVGGEHATSAEFDYCEFCGSFERNIKEHIERFHIERQYQPSQWMVEIADVVCDAVKSGGDAQAAATAALNAGADNITVEVNNVG